MQRNNKLPRQTVPQQFYHWNNWQNRVKEYEYEFCGRISDSQHFSYLNTSPQKNQKIIKKIKTIQVRSTYQQETSIYELTQKINLHRLPLIKQQIQSKKQNLAKSIQQNSLQLQWDNFRPMDQEKVCNLEYLLNRLNISHQRQKLEGTKVEPLKGYENLSPNKLKDYIKMFKNKQKLVPQPIYVSKKRIAQPKSNTQGEEEGMEVKFRLMNVRSEKKFNKAEKKQLLQNEKSSKKDMSHRSVSKRSNSRKDISRKYISRKEIQPNSELRKFQQKKLVK